MTIIVDCVTCLLCFSVLFVRAIHTLNKGKTMDKEAEVEKVFLFYHHDCTNSNAWAGNIGLIFSGSTLVSHQYLACVVCSNFVGMNNY